MTKQNFERAVYRKENVYVNQITNASFPFAHIAHIDKNKYLMFVKLNSINQIE